MPHTENPKDEIPQPFYEIDTIYEITINPDDVHQKLNSEFRFRDVYSMFSKIFTNMCNQDMELVIYPEISEPTHIIDGKYPRIHFHGTIVFKKQHGLASFLIKYSFLLSKTASVQINTFRPEYWLQYCKKQKHLMEFICKDDNLRYPFKKEKHKNVPKNNFFAPQETD